MMNYEIEKTIERDYLQCKKILSLKKKKEELSELLKGDGSVTFNFTIPCDKEDFTSRYGKNIKHIEISNVEFTKELLKTAIDLISIEIDRNIEILENYRKSVSNEN